MMEMVCETDSLDRDLQDSITELNIISEQMQIAIYERPIKVYEGNDLEVKNGQIYINGKLADSIQRSVLHPSLVLVWHH